MSNFYSTAPTNTGSLVLQLDANNPKSWSPNVFPNPLDIYNWNGGISGTNSTLTRDTTVTDSPAGGAPLKMVVNAADPYTNTYNGATWNLAPAAAGQTWTASVWVKASVAGQTIDGPFIFGASAAGNYLEAGSPGAISVGTSWTRVSFSYTLSNASSAYVQVRLDGGNTAGVTFWWDGFQVERSSSMTTFNSLTNVNGTNWFDVSGKNNSATMYGVIPVAADIVNYFDFATVSGASASSASLGFTFTNNMIPVTGGFTLSSWIKRTTTTSQDGLFSNSGAGDGFRYGVGSNGTYVLCGNPYTEATITHTSTYNTATWHHSAVVFDRAGIRTGTPGVHAYLDGVYQGTMGLSSPQIMSASVAPGLVRSPCCTLWTGKLSSFSAYSSYMSDFDIQMLFNSRRGKYGL